MQASFVFDGGSDRDAAVCLFPNVMFEQAQGRVGGEILTHEGVPDRLRDDLAA
jgi:hypothetical protein